jgi:hypothetical protein
MRLTDNWIKVIRALNAGVAEGTMTIIEYAQALTEIWLENSHILTVEEFYREVLKI